MANVNARMFSLVSKGRNCPFSPMANPIAVGKNGPMMNYAQRLQQKFSIKAFRIGSQ